MQKPLPTVPENEEQFKVTVWQRKKSLQWESKRRDYVGKDHGLGAR